MKKYYVLFVGTFLLGTVQTQAQTKIGAAGAPDPSAMLEITSGASSNKGLLLPKMTTAQRNAITSPATGLMIYNTTANEVQVNNGTPASPTWVTATATATGWATTGNTGTTPATNFIGTADNQPLVVRTNNTEKVRVTATGSVGIGVVSPATKLHVSDTGDVAIRVTSADANAAIMQLGNPNHGLRRNLTTSGGGPNDVAVFTSLGSSGNADLYLISNSVGNGSDSLPLDQFVLKNSGRVGIGTNAPTAKLQIVDTANAAIVVSSMSGTTSVNLGNGHHGITKNLTNAGGGSNDVALFTTMGDPGSPASIHLGVRADVGDTLDLNQFVLKGSGNVGIGTNSPLVRLQVVDSGDADIRVTSTTGATTGRMRVTLGNNRHGIVRNLTNSGGGTNEVALYTSTGPTSPGSIYLVASPTATDSLNLTQFALKNTGHVGIGTKDPTVRLHVVDTGDAIIRVGNIAGGRGHIQLGNDNHGMMRDLTGSGGEVNDVALFTSTASGSATASSLYLVCNPTSSGSNNLPLDQFVLKNTGNVGIGTNAPTAKLSVNGTTNNLSGTWGIFSDARVKTVDGEYEDGLATVMKIHPVKFHYNANAPFKSKEQQIGIIAQEMEQIAPYMVSKVNADGFTDLRQYNNQALPYMLVNAIQEQQAQIEALKAKNEQLEAANKVTAQLMERVKQMEQMMGINEIEGTSKVAGK